MAESSTDFLGLAQACRDAAAGRANDLAIEHYNAFLADFYEHGETFWLVSEAAEPMLELLDPKIILHTVIEALQSRQKQPGAVNLALRRFATVLELAAQIKEINDEFDAFVPEVQTGTAGQERPDGGYSPAPKTDVCVPCVRPDGTDSDSGDLHDSRFFQ
ncbi:MAG: hypothetical protein WC505_05790 [Patescibacteria group bacterium]